jgi:hypothetical protein
MTSGGVVLTANGVFVLDDAKKHYLYAFNRSNGALFFKVRVNSPGYFGDTRMWRVADNLVVFTPYSQLFTGYSITDGSELWSESFFTPAERYVRQTAFAQQMSAVGMGYLSGVYYAPVPLDLPHARALMGVASATAAPSKDRLYLLTTQKKDASKPVVIDLNLRTGATRTYRIHRGPRGCLPTILANEAAGYVLQSFGGTPACVGSEHVRAVRIPSN